MTASAMVAEFDDVAAWTAEAVEQLGDRQGARLAHLFTRGHISLQLLHAVKR